MKIEFNLFCTTFTLNYTLFFVQFNCIEFEILSHLNFHLRLHLHALNRHYVDSMNTPLTSGKNKTISEIFHEKVPCHPGVEAARLGPEPTPSWPKARSPPGYEEESYETEDKRSYAPPPIEWVGGGHSPSSNKAKGIGEMASRHGYGMGSESETPSEEERQTGIKTESWGAKGKGMITSLNLHPLLNLGKIAKRKLFSNLPPIVPPVR